MENLQLNWLSQKMLQQVRENDNNSRKEKQAKREQYNRRNSVELSGIPNSICSEDLENTVINVSTRCGH